MKKKTDNLLLAREELMSEIEEIKLLLEIAHSNFDNASDPDLVDSCIYEMNAIQYKYKYLLKQMRKMESLSS
ncbi:MAG: YaaL family protein [Roseburia sp.]|nr:YaaL family protein [Roseburia sp.]